LQRVSCVPTADSLPFRNLPCASFTAFRRHLLTAFSQWISELHIMPSSFYAPRPFLLSLGFLGSPPYSLIFFCLALEFFPTKISIGSTRPNLSFFALLFDPSSSDLFSLDKVFPIILGPMLVFRMTSPFRLQTRFPIGFIILNGDFRRRSATPRHRPSRGIFLFVSFIFPSPTSFCFFCGWRPSRIAAKFLTTATRRKSFFACSLF